MFFTWRWTSLASFVWRKNSAKQRSVNSSKPELSNTKSILEFLFPCSCCHTCMEWSTRIFSSRWSSWEAGVAPSRMSTSPLEIDKSHLLPHKQNYEARAQWLTIWRRMPLPLLVWLWCSVCDDGGIVVGTSPAWKFGSVPSVSHLQLLCCFPQNSPNAEPRTQQTPAVLWKISASVLQMGQTFDGADWNK